MRAMQRFAYLVILLFLPVAALAQQPGTLVTIAGGGQGDGTGVPATGIALSRPLGIALDAQNNLYIADIGNHRIRRVNLTTGIITTVAGTGEQGFGGDGGPATQALLDSPQDVAVDTTTGNLYIADTGNRRVRKVTPQGVISTFAGTGQQGFSGDGGPAAQATFDQIVAVTMLGHAALLVSDGLSETGQGNNRVRQIRFSDNTIATIAGNGTATASSTQDGGQALRAGLTPEQLSVASDGSVYIADFNNGRIRRVSVSPDTTVIINTVAGRTPTFAELATGDLFKGDGGSAALALLNGPSGVAVGSGGTIYIGDTGNGRIRAVDPQTKVIVTIAGGGTSEADGDLAIASALSAPSHLLLDANGDLIFVDTISGKVRKLINPKYRTPLFHLATTSINFDTVSVGDPVVRTIDIANQGNDSVHVQSATSDNPAFRIATPLPLTIGISQSAQIEVVFNPQTEGIVQGTVTLNTDDPRTPTAAFSVTGNGQVSRIGLLSNVLSFDRTFIGQSQTQSIRIANLGAGGLLVFHAVVPDSQFVPALAANDTLRIASGESRQLQVVFRPTKQGPQQTTLTLSTNDPANPTVILGLQGTGQQAKPGGFVDVADSLGLGDGGAGFGAAWADFDGDGDLDLYVTRSLQPNLLYRNDNGHFTEVGAALGVDDAGDGSSAIWGDIDRDGDLDLYVTNFGQPNRLYRNDGDHFTDIAPSVGVDDAGDGYGSAWADFDRDGDLDLYVANFGANRFYRNDGGHFVERADSLGVADTESGIQPTWVDYDNDGDPDLFLANSGPNRLFRNDDGHFTDRSADFNPVDTGPSFGAAWGDYDNDGDLDLYVAYFGAPNRLYTNDNGSFTDSPIHSVVADPGRGRGVVWGDFDNDGYLDLYVTNSGQPNLLYHNIETSGVRTFVEQGDSLGVALNADSRGVALADVDGDGALDLFVAVQNGPDRLYHNRGANGNWIAVRPIGTESGLAAIGLRVEIQYDNGQHALREIAGGASFLSQNAASAAFGLGSTEQIDVLTLHWPSGIVQQFQSPLDDLSANRTLTITEQRPLPPSTVQLQADAGVLLADGIAETGLTARLLNADGRLVLTDNRTIHFRIASGEGLIVGADSVTTSDGIAHARFRAGQTPGQVVIAADASGLASGQVIITLEKPFGDSALSIRTIAGSGTGGGYAGDGGPASQADLQSPQAVLADSAGNIYIADTGNQRIRKIDAASGIIQTLAGNGNSGNQGNFGNGNPAREVSISTPSGLVRTASGALLISETSGAVIRQVRNDTLQAFAGTGTPQFGGDGGTATGAQIRQPVGITRDRQGNIYFADTGNQRIRKIDVNGTITTVAGSGNPDQGAFSGDDGRAIDAQLNKPAAVAVDSLGNLYIADTQNQRIRKVDAGGTITTIAGDGTGAYSGDGGPAAQAELNAPSGLAVDNKGHLFIADTGNQRVRLLDLNTGLIQTVAGTGNGGFNTDSGGARAVSLNNPTGLAISPTGTVLIADQSNNRICELTVQFDLPSLFAPEEKSVDFNADGKLDFTDFLLFADAYGSSDTRYDLDSDGQVGFSDFLSFSTAYEEGRLTVRP